MSSVTPTRHTTLSVWICIMVPFALIISAALLASLIYCTKHRQKAKGNADEEGSATTNNGTTSNTTGMAMLAGGRGTVLIVRPGGREGGSSSAIRIGDSEGLNELGEAPPPYKVAGRHKRVGEDEDGSEDGASGEEVEVVLPVQVVEMAGAGAGAGESAGESAPAHPPAYDALARTQPTAVAGVTLPVASV
ncbi:hypothetical protein BD289DRAFT_486715 [Coniella lustricola]|uniref:Uncharacterized protein n=1 Tax=Coniella lustricola TaxID=2025994 RepID=A0A2T2ZU57_9PEZI|nr:hypothetical protein BD289DRAFT_486715 [Coniella lustricola]